MPPTARPFEEEGVLIDDFQAHRPRPASPPNPEPPLRARWQRASTPRAIPPDIADLQAQIAAT